MIHNMISVIIPVYNRQDVIEECVNSVLAQTYQNFEIIIIDDGSADGTINVCEKLVENEPRIKLLYGEHAGVSAARNKGIEAAVGEYIFFIDSDDVIYPLLLETLVEGMKNSDAAIAGTCVAPVSERYWEQVRAKLKEEPVLGKTTYHNHEESLYEIFHTSSPLACIGGVMMRRSLIGDTKFRTDIYIGEDFYFIYENLIKGAASVFLKQKWYYCRHHKHNSSWDYSFDGFWTRFYRRKLVWESEEALGRKEYADRQKIDAYCSFVTCMQRNKPYSKDSRKMRKVLKEYRKIILPAMSFKQKLLYLGYIYLPAVTNLIFKIRGRTFDK